MGVMMDEGVVSRREPRGSSSSHPREERTQAFLSKYLSGWRRTPSTWARGRRAASSWARTLPFAG